MNENRCPKCGKSVDYNPHNLPCFSCLGKPAGPAPPPSSVPGEAGPYYFWLTEKFGGAHLMGPGIADFPVEVWYTPDNLVALGNKAHAQGRASLTEELEALEVSKAKVEDRMTEMNINMNLDMDALRSKCERLEKALIAIGEGNYTCEKHARCNASEKAQAALSTPSVTPTEGN